jgi:hypothetical protein
MAPMAHIWMASGIRETREVGAIFDILMSADVWWQAIWER